MGRSPKSLEDGMADAHQVTSPNAHFLSGDVAYGGVQKAPLGGSLLFSIAAHAGLLVLVLFAATAVTNQSVTQIATDLKDVVWVEQKGPGGGGGGSPDPAPIKKAEIPKPKIAEVPTPRPDVPKQEVAPLPDVSVPVTSTLENIPGALQGLPTAQGTGGGGGSGTGIGGGKGSGIGPGEGGGTGGGVYRPGNGVVSPVLIFDPRPNYTSDAMRAKIQGIVTMEAVVMPDGSVGAVHIVRSLDQTFGLDQEAIKTVKKWRFRPGTRQGQPVPVLVEIEMTFTLR
jgi:periplasmic protein TonB